jgi:Ca2+-binding RTX toxin-like protein
VTSPKAATCLIAGLAALALAPASASAGAGVTVSLSPSGSLQITGDAEVNHVALVTVTPSGGSPDFVIGDVAAGISDPLPSACPRVDPTIVRCPLSMIHSVNVGVGAGNDTVSVKGLYAAAAYDIQQIYIKLAKGNDVAVGGPASPNTILGGAGRDMIMGGPFGDRLFGGGQDDFLVGLGGNDLFQCGSGDADLFNDGPGKDLVNVKTCERRVHREFVP